MKIKKKIMLSLSVLSIIGSIICIISVLQLNSINDKYSEIVNEEMKGIVQIGDIRRSIALQALYNRTYIINPTPENQKTLDRAISTTTESINDLSNSMEKIFQNSIKASKASQSNLIKYNNDIVQNMDNGNIKEAKKIAYGVSSKEEYKLLDSMDQLRDDKLKHIEEIKQHALDNSQKAKYIMYLLIVVMIVASSIINAILATRIANPLLKIIEQIKLVTKGDLTGKDITVKSKDEIGILSGSFKEMKESLRQLIGNTEENATVLKNASEDLQRSTDEVDVLSNIISKKVNESAERIHENMESANEGAVATSETATGVQRIAEETMGLQKQAMTTQALAKEGEETIANVNTQMQVIHQSTMQVSKLVTLLNDKTKEISKFSQIINDITEQTNLLALNAAIEAARAGEHGKGFAVVADEVRKLAEESKNSASQIVDLTNTIVGETKKVETAIQYGLSNVVDGVNLIEEAGENFSKITGSVANITDQITNISAVTEEISASAEEVAASSEQIATSSEITSSTMEEIKESVQNQVATIDGIDAISKDLTQKAETLQQSIQKFKLS